MNPGQVARALADVVQLRLLPGPEDAQGEKAHQVSDPLRPECAEGVEQLALAVHLSR